MNVLGNKAIENIAILLKLRFDSCLNQNNVTFAKDQNTSMNLSQVGLLFELMRKTKNN